VPAAVPVLARAKSSVDTPLTGSLKVTLKLTEVSVEAAPPAGAMALTTGAAPSMTRALFAPSELAAPGTGRVRVAVLPAASLMVPPLRASAVVET